MSLLLELRFNGQMLATGTGFLCASSRGPLLVTNRHNLTGRRQDNNQPISPTGGVPDEVVIWHNSESGLGNWISKIEPLYHDGRPVWKEHPRIGSNADFVALPLTSTASIMEFAYNMTSPGPAIMVGPSDYLSVIGFPFGMTAGGALPVWATGFMASEPDIDFNELPVFLIDCRSRPGQSGSAVIAYRSSGTVAMEDGSAGMFAGPVFRFLGIYSGRINAESDLGIVWKASAIAELVSAHEA